MENNDTEPRYYVHDRLAHVASQLVSQADRRTRYYVIDRTNGEVVDELMSKRAATLTARDLNVEADGGPGRAFAVQHASGTLFGPFAIQADALRYADTFSEPCRVLPLFVPVSQENAR